MVKQIADEVGPKVDAYRRDFHKYAEFGWTEFRTASLIARRLVELGYMVQAGQPVVRAEDRMGLPPAGVLERCWQRAVAQGGDEEFLQAVKGGFTGVVGSLSNGPGPTVGMRFDIDALQIRESQSPDHRPAREGFASINENAAHACGHDAHAAVGLGVAAVLARMTDQVRGTIRLIFQPAEEGVRGAKAMVGAGVVDGIDFMLAHHLYSRWPVGDLAPQINGHLATTKFDATLTGLPAHAAGSPQEGRNALLAAATAVLNLYAIPRHRDGATRINVGRLEAGTSRNVIPPSACLAIETRGKTSELNGYMYDYALRILEAAAAMHGCTLQVREMGSAQTAACDQALADRVAKTAARVGGFSLHPPEERTGSEDYTCMMERVQGNGGLATYIGIGANLGGWGHHTPEFDLAEEAFTGAVQLLSLAILDIMNDEEG